MPYSIYTEPQAVKTTRTVPRGMGRFEAAIVPPVRTYPPGTALFYAPEGFNIYSDDSSLRRVLLSDPDGTATPPEILAVFPAILDAKYSRLWQAAHDWEQRNISGVGLSILSLGVAQGKPKSLAVAAWSNNLWMNLYYPRKALISLDTEPDCDFSAAGDMPYTVPELSVEVFG